MAGLVSVACGDAAVPEPAERVTAKHVKKAVRYREVRCMDMKSPNHRKMRDLRDPRYTSRIPL
jgi:hypothetical protein